jgi:hypothetical protein
MMLSFAIFVTFIIFLYSVLSPAINLGEDKNLILNYVETGIIKNTSANLTSATIQIEEPNPGQNCVILQGFLLGISESTDDYYQAISKDGSGAIQPSYLNLYDLKIDRLDKKNTFFKIYFSSNFTRLISKEISNCKTLLEDEGYKVGSVTIDNYMFERKIIHLVDFYNEDYQKLKEDLKVPIGNEFWFNFTKGDSSSISPPAKEIPATNIFSNDVPIQYVDANANVQSGFINIKVW